MAQASTLMPVTKMKKAQAWTLELSCLGDNYDIKNLNYMITYSISQFF